MIALFSGIPDNLTYNDWLLDNFFLHNTLVVTGVLFLFFLAMLFLNRRELWQEIKIEKKVAIILLFIFLLGFWLRNSKYSLGEHTDGWVYAESAKFIIAQGIYVKDCAIGNLQSCRLYEQVLAPPGYPFLISIAYMLFGINTIYACIISGILGSLTILLIFYITKKLFDEKTGLISALIFALFPYDLLFAGSGHVRSTSLFFIALTIFFYLIAIEKDKIKNWVLLAATLSFAVYVRQENIVLLAPMVLGLFLFGYFTNAKHSKKPIEFKAKLFFVKFLLPALVFVLTQLPVQRWVTSGYLGVPSIFSIQSFFITTPRIIADFFITKNFYAKRIRGFSMLYNPLVSICFFASIFFLLKGIKRKQQLFLSSIFIVYFLVVTSYSPNVKQSYDYIRQSHPLVMPVAIISAFVLDEVNKRIIKRDLFFLFAIAAILALSSNLDFTPTLFNDARQSMPPTEALHFSATNSTPNNCTIITPLYLVPVSDAIPENRRRTVNYWLIDFTKDLVNEEIAQSNCVIFFDDTSYATLLAQNRQFFEELKKERLFAVESSESKIIAYKIK